MKSILHSLYNGDIIPCARRYRATPKQRELLRRIENEERYFTEKMSPDDYQRFEIMSNLRAEAFSEEENDIFTYGFTLGALIMSDIGEQAKLIIE